MTNDHPLPLTDADKLDVIAAWFDMWDRQDVDRLAILDDHRFPGKNDVQRDLRRIAGDLRAARSDRDELDGAWREAEAALPDGWMFDVGTGASQGMASPGSRSSVVL